MFIIYCIQKAIVMLLILDYFLINLLCGNYWQPGLVVADHVVVPKAWIEKGINSNIAGINTNLFGIGADVDSCTHTNTNLACQLSLLIISLKLLY